MKGKTLKHMGGLVALIALATAGYVFGQTTTTSTAQANIQASVSAAKAAKIATARTKASDSLASILAEANIIPLEIYPPGYLDDLQAMADGRMMPTMFMVQDGPTSKHLKPGDKVNMAYLDPIFTMGSPTSEAERGSDESQHTAVITYHFYIGKYEVTQDEYNQVMGSNPSWFTSANGYTDDLDRPIENITWAQANTYCSTLTSQALANGSIPTGWAYRLPTEAEWEYSARGKTMQDVDVPTITAQQPYFGIPYGDMYMSHNDLSQQIGSGYSGGLGSITLWLSTANSGYDLANSRIILWGYSGTGGVNGGYTGGFAACIFDYSSGAWNSTDGTIPVPITYAYHGRDDSGNHATQFDPSKYYVISLGVGYQYPIGQPITWHGLQSEYYLSSADEVLWGNHGNVGNNFYTSQSQETQTTYDSLCFQIATTGSYQSPTFAPFSFGYSIRGGDANFDDHYEYGSLAGTINVSSPTVPALAMTAPVGSYQANGFGQQDMHGNVSEWCQDNYGTYPTGAPIDYAGPTSGSTRVVRGGSWADHGVACRSAVRLGVNPSTASSHIGFRIVLAPTTPDWKTTVTTTPSQLAYGNYPIKQSGKDNLIVITHGWLPFPLPKDVSFVDTMSNAVQSYLTSHGMGTWQVYGYKWEDNAWKVAASDALQNARGEGVNLGSAIAIQGWSHVHFISHSAGAELIQEASQWVKAQGATVQCTFLDPYVGNDYAGVANYGDGTDWSDCYFSHDVTGDVTEQPLNHAYNVNVTQLGPKTGITKFRSQATGQMEVCTRTIKYHGWPIDFYMNTITGNNVDGDYAGFGFPLSKEGGGWSSGVPSYTPGNIPAQVLGTPDPSCVNDISITPPTWPNLIPDFVGFPTIQSDTGSNQKGTGSLGLTPGSPSWLSTVIASTNSLNTISFDAQFSGVTGSEDMLSVLWDGDSIGTVDERIVQPGLQHYSLKFANAAAFSVHVLSFRLDPFTSAKSSMTLTNVALTQIGPSQPFTLSTTTNAVNGIHVWQLTGDAGFAYGIQASTNLASTNWTDIAELINTNGVVQFYDQDSTNYPMRFYRAYVPMKQ